MKASKTNEKDLVRKVVRNKARRAAEQFIEEIHVKAARDVENRLKFLDPDAEKLFGTISPSARCGRADDEGAGVNSGYEEVFERYYTLGIAALNRGDAEEAAYYLGRCLSLPVSEEKKNRQMIRDNLKLATLLKSKRL